MISLRALYTEVKMMIRRCLKLDFYLAFSRAIVRDAVVSDIPLEIYTPLTPLIKFQSVGTVLVPMLNLPGLAIVRDRA